MADWPAIMREHGPLVWRTAYRLLGHEADAADCFQETFVSALEVSRREPVEHWPGLLMRLATTRSLDLLRRRIRESKSRGALPDCETLASDDAGPVHEAQASELGERLRQAMAQLPPRYSEIFSLRYVSGLSYEEIASEMDMSLDAVGVMLHRARARLRELLATGRIDQPSER